MDSEADRRHSSPGFPHSDIRGSRPACGFPRLFAASYVLLRLLMPGHSPYTLSSLTITLLLIHMVFHQDLFSCQRTSSTLLRRELPRERCAIQLYTTWWSWTESNRRPPACKAGALPTELQPHSRWKESVPDIVRLALRGSRLRWWAWIELNYRPRAYQARALTN